MTLEIHQLPAVNAALNGLSAVWLLLGYTFIRRGNIPVHRAFMILALVTSTAFLTSYLIYHFHTGSTPFQSRGFVRGLYFTILISHTILAVVIVPMVLVTLVRALRRRFVAHRRLARVTLPLWLYVSITGVVIYFMLYHLDPALSGV